MIQETNTYEPDLVAVAGDLTTSGHRREFEEAKSYLDRLECQNIVIVMGNHDAKNVGFRHFEDLFGIRERAVTIPGPEGEAKVVALDSTKPDLTEGEIGREHYGWLDSKFRGWALVVTTRPRRRPSPHYAARPRLYRHTRQAFLWRVP